MRQILPEEEILPENTKLARFSPPEELKGEGVVDALGVVHMDPETGQQIAFECMFELEEEEIELLRHRPYLTLAFLADHVHVFQIRTSYPAEYLTEAERVHHHICPKCKTFHSCEDPRHRPQQSKQDRYLLCEECLENINAPEQEKAPSENGQNP